MDLKAPLKTNIFILKLGGIWPEGDRYVKGSFYTLYSLMTFTLIVVCHNASQAVNVYYIYDQLETLTASIVVMLTEIMGMVKFQLFRKNMKLAKSLMVMLDDELFQPTTSEQRGKLKARLKNWRRVYLGFTFSAGATLLLWGFYPLLDGSFRLKKLPFIAWYPYDHQTSPFYELTYVYQITANYFIAFTNQNVDSFISALLMYVSAECELLCDRLKNLKGSSFRREFVRTILHHQEILRFAESTERFVSVMAFGQFVTSVVSICMTMFQLTVVQSFTPTFYTLVCCQSAVFTQVFVYCWFGNEVVFESGEVAFSAYQSDLTSCDLKTRKDVAFFVMGCRKPIVVKAVGFFGLTLNTFTSVLRTSWSYFALLKQINK